MLTYEKLQRKPKHFQAFTGVSVAQFSEILKAVRPIYAELEQERLTRPDRKRKIGGGRNFTLSLENRLMVTLMYFRLYVSYALLGYLFNLDGTNVGREINQRMLPALLSILPVPMQDELLSGRDEPPQIGGGKRIKTLKKLMETHPEIKEVWVDATEQAIQRPSEKLARKQYYSGKQSEHTIKSQLLTTKKLILHVSGNLPGSVSDSTVLAGSGIMHSIPEDVQVNLDRGYEGAENRYPNNKVYKPKRAQRNHPLTLFENLYNRIINKTRILVEHVIGRLKKFRIMSELYRNRRSAHAGYLVTVAGLINFRALNSLYWA
jgi:DDE superfamily endonuclease/Helix-turn-helix of DDE superfamily endonuclease